MEIFGALLAGSFIGAVLGFIGAGGAMLSVPILIYFFNFAPKQATVAALAIVFLAAFSGAIPKFRKGEILVREAFSVWAIGLVTNLGGAVLAKHLTDNLILSGFSLILIAAGISMLLPQVNQSVERKVPLPTLILISLIIGSMTGIFGVGGGFLAIPVLVLGFNSPLAKAAGTSLLIIALNCFTALIGHRSSWGQISWHVPITIAISAVVISLFASHHSSKVPTTVLKKSFAYLLFSIAIWTLIKTWLLA
ncbi:MAG: sulfite exporter TauE/SafE family protein [Actinobacteria bacterium]|nr:sulfite exporter TauE/SafE family protein [Actinomycetota bacterium]